MGPQSCSHCHARIGILQVNLKPCFILPKILSFPRQLENSHHFPSLFNMSFSLPPSSSLSFFSLCYYYNCLPYCMSYIACLICDFFTRLFSSTAYTVHHCSHSQHGGWHVLCTQLMNIKNFFIWFLCWQLPWHFFCIYACVCVSVCLCICSP